MKRPEPVLVLHMLPNETVEAIITAVSGSFSYYLWSDVFTLEKYEPVLIIVKHVILNVWENVKLQQKKDFLSTDKYIFISS